MERKDATTIFLAMHKGGSSFIANRFAAAIDEVFGGLSVINIGNQIDDGVATYEDLAVAPRGTVLVRVYPEEYDKLLEQTPSAQGRLSDTKLVVLQRDPRDAAVSRYFSSAFSHSPPPTNAEAFLARRDMLIDIGPDAGIIHTARQTCREFNHLYRIIDERPDALITSYEDMIVDYRGWLRQIGTYLGWDLANEEAVFDHTRDSFEFPVVGDPSKHVRRITPGNWVQYDRPKLRDTFDGDAGDTMTRAGYGWPKN